MYKFDFIVSTTVWEQFKNEVLKINFNCEEPELVRYVPSPFLYAEEAKFVTDDLVDCIVIECLIRTYFTNGVHYTLTIGESESIN